MKASMKVHWLLLLLLVGVIGAGSVHADKLALAEIKAPSDLENIHVVKVASDKNASDFVIFVKQQVPLHKHVTHSESIFVLEGTGIFQLGEKTLTIGPGDYVKVPEGTPHSLAVTSTIPLKALSIQAPEFFGKDRVSVN
jgi:mannose-6-phosphate isomerase-like protein (cupin superfamily)